MAIKYPLRVKQIMTRSRIIAVIIFIWVYTGILNMVPMVFGWHEWKQGDWCDLALVYSEGYLLGLFMGTLTVILSVISVLYFSIFRTLSQRKKNVRASTKYTEPIQKQKLKSIERDRKIIKALAIVVLVYALCFVPMCFGLVFSMYSPGFRKKMWVFRMVTNVAAMLNSGMNPVIYNNQMNSFREAFRKMLCARCQPTTSGREEIEVQNVQQRF